MGPGPWYTWSGKDLLINVHVQTRAKRDEIGEIHNGRLKIRITAPPVSGKANKHLSAYLAGEFRQPRSDVEIIKGALARDKLIKIRQAMTPPDWFHEFIQTDKNTGR